MSRMTERSIGCPSDVEFNRNFDLQASLTCKISVKFPAVSTVTSVILLIFWENSLIFLEIRYKIIIGRDFGLMDLCLLNNKLTKP